MRKRIFRVHAALLSCRQYSTGGGSTPGGTQRYPQFFTTEPSAPPSRYRHHDVVTFAPIHSPAAVPSLVESTLPGQVARLCVGVDVEHCGGTAADEEMRDQSICQTAASLSAVRDDGQPNLLWCDGPMLRSMLIAAKNEPTTGRQPLPISRFLGSCLDQSSELHLLESVDVVVPDEPIPSHWQTEGSGERGRASGSVARLYHGSSPTILSELLRRGFQPEQASEPTPDDVAASNTGLTEFSFFSPNLKTAATYSTAVPSPEVVEHLRRLDPVFETVEASRFAVLQVQAIIGETKYLDDAPLSFQDLSLSDEGGTETQHQQEGFADAAVYWLDGSTCYAFPRRHLKPNKIRPTMCLNVLRLERK